MPLRAVPPSSRIPQWSHRTGALALVVVLLLTGCVTRRSPAPPQADAERVFTRLPTDFAPVQVDEATFNTAMAGLILEVPPLASPRLTGEKWRSELAPHPEATKQAAWWFASGSARSPMSSSELLD